MKHLILKKIGLVIFLCLILSLSCGGKVTTRSNPTNKFTINGVVVKDLSLGEDIAYFTILRDSVAFDSAVVKAGTYTLNNQKSGKYIKEAPKLFDFGQSVSISITSAKDSFSVATSVVMPDSFLIDELPANDSLNAGGHNVHVSWQIAQFASGYFISVVKPDTIPGLVGYTVRDENNDRAENVPPDAFRVGQSLIQGIYEVYVIAYYGSFLEYPGMIFELPTGLPTNNVQNANGTIGAGVVAQKKRIRVTVQ